MKTPESKGWYTSGPAQRCKDTVPVVQPPHWSFDPKADRANRKANRIGQTKQQSLDELETLLRAHGIGR